MLYPKRYALHSREFLAIHEAGHVVVGRRFDWPLIGSYLLEPGDDGAARTDWDWPEGFLPDATQCGLVAVAGVVATAIWDGASTPNEVWWPHPAMPTDEAQHLLAAHIKFVEERDKLTHPYPPEMLKVARALDQNGEATAMPHEWVADFSKECLRQSFETIAEHWPAVQRIARILATVSRIEAETVGSVIRGQ